MADSTPPGGAAAAPAASPPTPAPPRQPLPRCSPDLLRRPPASARRPPPRLSWRGKRRPHPARAHTQPGVVRVDWSCAHRRWAPPCPRSGFRCLPSSSPRRPPVTPDRARRIPSSQWQHQAPRPLRRASAPRLMRRHHPLWVQQPRAVFPSRPGALRPPRPPPIPGRHRTRPPPGYPRAGPRIRSLPAPPLPWRILPAPGAPRQEPLRRRAQPRPPPRRVHRPQPTRPVPPGAWRAAQRAVMYPR